MTRNIETKRLWTLVAVLLALSASGVFAAQKTSAAPKPAAAAAKVDFSKLPKVWHSDATKHDFRVEVTNELFRADWINVPPLAAKQGAHIHTECRKTGAKWVGTSDIKMLFAVPNAPPGSDTKLCSFNVRFEVDSITPLKISGHSDALHGFDVSTCRVQQTKWAEFSYVPKK